MSSVSSCRTRCGYPEHAVAIKHPDRKLLRRAKTVPYPTYCISSAAPPFDTVDLSRNVPTVFAVLSAPVRWFRFSSARFVTGHGQALAACHVHIRRHIQTLTTAPVLPAPRLFRPDDPQRSAFSFSLHCQTFPPFLLLLPVSLWGES
jgi:hypothetical protein